jgi:hypothetical protein
MAKTKSKQPPPQKTTPQTTGLGSPAVTKIASAMLMGGLAGAIPKATPLTGERGSDVTPKRKGRGK